MTNAPIKNDEEIVALAREISDKHGGGATLKITKVVTETTTVSSKEVLKIEQLPEPSKHGVWWQRILSWLVGGHLRGIFEWLFDKVFNNQNCSTGKKFI